MTDRKTKVLEEIKYSANLIVTTPQALLVVVFVIGLLLIAALAV